MLANLTCKACCAGGLAISKANKCAGADHCMAARGFKVCLFSYAFLEPDTIQSPCACSPAVVQFLRTTCFLSSPLGGELEVPERTWFCDPMMSSALRNLR